MLGGYKRFYFIVEYMEVKDYLCKIFFFICIVIVGELIVLIIWILEEKLIVEFLLSFFVFFEIRILFKKYNKNKVLYLFL